jgi:hypothetical protein
MQTLDELSRARRNGHIDLDILRDEVKLALSPAQYKGSDICITYMHAMGVFCVYNTAEIKDSIDGWKQMKAVCLPCNVKPIMVNDKEYWMFVIQPKDMSKTPMSPLALAFDTLVSGYTYITHSKAFADNIVKCLAVKKSVRKPKHTFSKK